MVRNTDGRARAVPRIVALIAPALVGLALASACTEQRSAIGGACLKDQDCISGVCAQLLCASTPPLLATPYTPIVEAAADAPAEAAARDGSVVVPPDATTPTDDGPVEASEPEPDAMTVGPGEASEDVVDAGHSDAPTDGPSDAIADAGEAG
jgi:hypothetical protein